MHPFLLPGLYQMSDVSTSFAGFTLREAQFHIFHIYQENELQLEIPQHAVLFQLFCHNSKPCSIGIRVVPCSNAVIYFEIIKGGAPTTNTTFAKHLSYLLPPIWYFTKSKRPFYLHSKCSTSKSTK